MTMNYVVIALGIVALVLAGLMVKASRGRRSLLKTEEERYERLLEYLDRVCLEVAVGTLGLALVCFGIKTSLESSITIAGAVFLTASVAGFIVWAVMRFTEFTTRDRASK